MKNYFTPEVIAELRANTPLPRHATYDAVVRLIDLLVSGLAVGLLSPLMAAIALAIRCEDGGPILFRQERLGKGGRPFRIAKFRSMVVNAEHRGAKWRIVKGDPRITRVGKVLREYHLDEIPQLFNVLRGEMSLVGPRPALVFQKDHYEPWEMPRLAVAPGMTGLAQVSGGNALDWDHRIIIDLCYVRRRNIGMYLLILGKTVVQLFTRKGICAKDGGVRGWTRPVPDGYRERYEAISAVSEAANHV